VVEVASRPRLEVEWGLVVARTFGIAILELRGSLKLCAGATCIRKGVFFKDTICKTEECRRLVLENTQNDFIETVARSREPVFDLPIKVPEVEELARAADRVPGCAWDVISDLSTSADGKVIRVLAGTPSIGDPEGKWSIYIVDGGLVLVTSIDMLLVCLRPECDLSKCTEAVPRYAKEIAKTLADAVQELAQLALSNPEAVVGLLATTFQ